MMQKYLKIERPVLYQDLCRYTHMAHEIILFVFCETIVVLKKLNRI